MKTVGVLVSVLVLKLQLLHVIQGQPKPRLPLTPGKMYSREGYTNKTMDQLITEAMGGIKQAGQKIISPGDTITAELDMVLTQRQFMSLYEPPSYNTRKKRKAVKRTNLRWTNNEIPYSFTRAHFTDAELYFIKQAMTEWERYTCLNFRPAKSGDRNVVHFQNGEGCNSQLGMVGGVQILNLDIKGCRWTGLYLHEIGHAIGLVHEHQLPNRDDYIEILYQNVEPDMRLWFNKYAKAEIDTYNDRVKYEYSSVMHYGTTAFAEVAGTQTIRARDQAREQEIGHVHLKQLSFSDVQAVNLMYNCGGSCPSNVKCRDNGFLDQNCRCICPDGTADCTDGASTTRSSSCSNKENSWKCSLWAAQGECERNGPFMSENCRKACRLCESKTTQTAGECKDDYPTNKCAVWKENGDCVANPSWMARHCRRTCKACVGDDRNNPAIACKNAHPDNEECQRWALDGECQINLVWMSQNCALSCKVCDRKNVTVIVDEAAACQDQYDSKQCAVWAQEGECTKNPVWMLPNCRKSCKYCNDEQEIECKNIHGDQSCNNWAASGECTKNPTWMRSNCRLACKACKPNVGNGTTDRSVTTKPTVATTTVDGRIRTTTRRPDTNATCRNAHNDIECEVWARAGHCDVNPIWMKKNCQRSCRVCVSTTATVTERMPDGRPCRNDYIDSSQCQRWADGGHCSKNPSWMTLYCRLSCKACNVTNEGSNGGSGESTGGDNCENLHYNSSQCDKWASIGECANNPSFMRTRCQRSCKACPESGIRKSGNTGQFGDTEPATGTGASQKTAANCFILAILWLAVERLLCV